jgi:cell wall-associated NlpC family hydrolase
MSLTGAQIVAEAEKFVHAPYVYGGTTPSGWDCSGFVQYVLTTLGEKNVPRTSEAQWAWVTKVSKADLQPGDLVFAQFPGDNASPGHVGIYVGGGRVLSAEDPAQGTNYDTLSDWGSAIVGYGRPPTATTTADTTSDTSGGLLSFPSQITGFFSDANTFVTAIMWITKPSNWVRVVAFLGGIALLLFAIHALIAAGSGQPLVKTPSIIPVPV